MANRNLRNQVRRLRFENGQMTQQQLAEAAGVTRQTIIAIEADRKSKGKSYLPRVQNLFFTPHYTGLNGLHRVYTSNSGPFVSQYLGDRGSGCGKGGKHRGESTLEGAY